jgi:glycosyltransferase involved in cell wall biosynthesis
MEPPMMDCASIKVLCIFQDLALPGSGRNKEGVYPEILKAHVLAGFRSFAVTLNWINFAAKQAYCADLGVTLIEPAWRLDITDARRLLQLSGHRFAWDFAPAFRRRSFLRLLQQYRVIAGVAAFVRQHHGFDVISGLTAIENTGRVAALVSLMYGSPLVVRENRTHYTRGMIVGRRAEINKDIADLAQAILAVSDTLGRNLSKALSVDAAKMTTLPNAVADQFFDKPSSSSKYGEFTKGSFCFAGWTSWRDIKRVDLAIESFALVHAKSPETCMILAGAVPEWARLKVKNMGLDKCVWLAGQLNRNDIHQLAHSCDCCIVPSDHDPGNNSVLEAMAAGKPIVVRNCGGAESRITDDRLGRVVESGDPLAFAAAMYDVMDNVSMFDPTFISSECRRMYSVEAMSRRLTATYQGVVRRRSWCGGGGRPSLTGADVQPQ